MEAGDLHCTAGNGASLASGTLPLVLEAPIKG